MIKSKITLYRVDWPRSLNPKIENIADWLPGPEDITVGPFVTSFVGLARRKAVRLPLEAATLTETQKVNYAKVENIERKESGDFVRSVYYYFVNNTLWKANGTLEVDLELDAVNSLLPKESLIKYFFDKSTMIVREHRDRFSNAIAETTGGFTLVPVFDKVDEGFSPLLYKKSDSVISDDRLNLRPGDGLVDFAFIYSYSAFDKATQRTPSLAIVASKPLPAVGTTAEGTTLDYTISAFSNVNYSYVEAENGCAIMKAVEYPYAPFDITTKKGKYYLPFEDYGVFPWLVNQSFGLAGRLKLGDYINEPTSGKFASNYVIDDYPLYDETKEERQIIDPKLKTSQFNPHRFVYDVFSIDVPFEQCEPVSTEKSMALDLFIYASTSMSSLFAFKAEPKRFAFEATEDYPLMCFVNRNNEQLLINDEYLNYLRNGYNYDVKDKTLANLSRWGGVAGSALGTVAGVALAPFTGGASLAVAGISLANSAITAITGTISAENSFDRKKAQNSAKGYSVAGSTDLGLLKGLQTNKLRYITYEPSERVKKQLDELFYYYGYKASWQGVPDIATRRWFNFLQCNPKFNYPYSEKDAFELLADKLREGVTFFHCVDVNGAKEWDIEREKENIETKIYSIIHGGTN